MMTSLLLVDVQGFEALAKGQADPAALSSELTHTMHGLTRQIAVMRAYCSTRVSTYRRTAYRDAGFEIVETAGADETLIMMSLDLYELSASDATYEEAIILGGTTDYTALARLARERLMMVSVADHAAIPSSLEALADGLIDLDDLDIDRSHPATQSVSLKPRERTKPDPLAARPSALDRSDKTVGKVEEKAEDKAKTSAKSSPVLSAGSTASSGLAAAGTVSATANGAAPVTPAKVNKTEPAPKTDDGKQGVKPAVAASGSPATKQPETTPADKPAAVSMPASKPVDLETELEKSIGSSLPDDLSSELEAEISAELLADVPAANTPKKPAGDANASDDTNIDALFANMTSAADIETASKETTSVDPAVKVQTRDVPPLAEAEADTTDVDELLSRLMSDDLASDAPAEKKTSLNVVPER